VTQKASTSCYAAELQQISGIGPKLLVLFKKMGVETIEDALYHLPLRYEDRRQMRKISRLQADRSEIFLARVLAAGEQQTSHRRKQIYEVIVGDDTAQISLKWFHYRKSWLQKRYPVGQLLLVIGEVRSFGHTREIHHPETELIAAGQNLTQFFQQDPLKFGRILPVYPLTEGLTQHRMRKIWYQLVPQYCPTLPSCLPTELLEKRKLLPLEQALLDSHWPPAETSLAELDAGKDPYRRSIVYDEFFYLELGLALKRRGVALTQGFAFTVEHRYTKPLAQMLPFRLTPAQRRVLGEIKQDMMAPMPMHRLLQGDVGSGKTIVALMAALVAIENGTQVAVVAPTEILAEQHYQNFRFWLEKLQLRCELLRSNTPTKEKKNTLADLQTGAIHLLVGTHAILQQGVHFKRLGLGIIDEQHRFGVKQRGVLKQKGANPDMLVMTATPIPRTLSMTLYGDLSLSVIDQMPPGRTPVTTHHFSATQRNQAYQSLQAQLNEGHQAYVVYPLVEETENSDLLAATEACEDLKHHFPRARIGLLHGRLKPVEKDQIMQNFRTQQLDILVATTVIEVGIDVPNATIMLIEHAERFGLAQLHQLRGRVGRGGGESFCFLISTEQFTEDARRRLAVMVETNDGFRIAEADLEIRGPGEFLGTRQAGLPNFRVASLVRDTGILERAREDAFAYAEETNYLNSPESVDLKNELYRRWSGRLDLATIG